MTKTEILVLKSSAYTVDSASIYTRYSRGTDASIVDTLRFEFFTSNVSSELGVNYFTGMNDKYNSDTVFFKTLWRKSLSLDVPSKMVIDYLLNESDTLDRINGFNIFKVATRGIDVNAGGFVGVTTTFIPGYSYTPTDVLNDLNYMSFYSYEEQGENTYPSYLPGSFNASYHVSIYHLDPSNYWNTRYAPAWGYSETWHYENHLIQMKISVASGDGIESTTNNNLTVGQNSPNPFNGNTKINYKLEKTSNVNITIYNITGAKVMDLNQGRQTAGSYNLDIDGSNLQAGVYFYTFTANNNSITKKMIVY